MWEQAHSLRQLAFTNHRIVHLKYEPHMPVGTMPQAWHQPYMLQYKEPVRAGLLHYPRQNRYVESDRWSA